MITQPRASDRVALPDEAVTIAMCCTQIEEVLQQLPERERNIIQLRYGLNDGRYRSIGGGWGRVRDYARARPPDRGCGATMAASPIPWQAAARLS